ncbi:MAG: Endoribonuclease [Blastococcus sp.]|jgi:2-iminobutanoate/2-iminopropanoate deaminase|nr:Endoribonuclease [Blastococcus sp.]
MDPDVTSVESWEREEFRVPGLAEPISHYTDAVVAGPLVFISGCAPVDSSGRLAGSDIRAQARQVHENLKLVLDATGSDFSRITKVVVYVTDMSEREAINDVRREYFGSARPASTLVEVAALAIPGMRVEIEATAVRGTAAGADPA